MLHVREMYLLQSRPPTGTYRPRELLSKKYRIYLEVELVYIYIYRGVKLKVLFLHSIVLGL
jgi:hypothetical protein